MRHDEQLAGTTSPVQPAGEEPQGLAARACAAYAQVVEERRQADLQWERRVCEQRTELLVRRLRALGVEDPELVWEESGPGALVEGLRFELESDALVLVGICPTCDQAMRSYDVGSLDVLGALLEREGAWPWHECEPSKEPPETTHEEVSEPMPPDGLRRLIEELA